MRIHGKIASWNDEKGFGFIAPSTGGRQIFVHVKSLRHHTSHPEVGAGLTYEVGSDAQGRLRATNVELARDVVKLGAASKAFLTGTAFLLFVAALAVLGFIPMLLFWFYLGLSMTSLVIYALDKSAAKKGGQRTPESTLHFLSLLGGWPGALIAQQLLRHKSSKKSFRVVFWATVVLNVAVLMYLVSPYGSWLVIALRRMAT